MCWTLWIFNKRETNWINYRSQACNLYFFAEVKLDARCRPIEYISLFCTDIRHVAGVSNVVSDILSRREDAIIDVLKKTISKYQEDEDVQNIKRNE